MATQQATTNTDTATTNAPTSSRTSESMATTTKTPSTGDQDPVPPAETTSKASTTETSKPVSSPTVTSPSATSASSTPTDTTAKSETHSTSATIRSTGTIADTRPTNTGSGPTATPTNGVSSSSSPPSPTSSGYTQSFSKIPIPLPPISEPTPVTPSFTPVVSSSTSMPAVGSVPVVTSRIVQVKPPAPTTMALSSSQQSVLTPLAQTHVSSEDPAGPRSTPPPHAAIPVAPSSDPPTPTTPSAHDSKDTSGNLQADAKTPTPTTTSTVTEAPETTLSTPKFVTVTDADHHTSLSVPPVFTSIGVSTLSNGELVSVTHVIANPTGIWGVSTAASRSGFFANSGAVAGVFLVVGLLIAGICAGICFFLRRRRRRTPRFVNSISRPLPMPDNPFEDPRSLSPPPEMRYASGYTDRTLVIDAARPPRNAFDNGMEQNSVHSSRSRRSGERLTGLGLAGIGANGHRSSIDTRTSSDSRSRRSSRQGSVGLALTNDQRHDVSSRALRQELSSAQSSPSIYPPSLPALQGEDNLSLVNVPLSNNNSAARISPLPSPTSNASATRIASPTMRKPVPPHPDLVDLAPVPVSPIPRAPQQQQAKPPVLPPRSPLRNSTLSVRSLSRSPPPPPLSGIRTQFDKPANTDKVVLHQAQSYEPLTPPKSFSSISPSGSSTGHEPPSPLSSAGPPSGSNSAANPFNEAVFIGLPPGLPPPAPPSQSGKKETFYTRTGVSQRRPSVEWRH